MRPPTRLLTIPTAILTIATIATVTIFLLFLCPSTLNAADLNSLIIKGDVSEVEILRSSGTYLETLLHVWDYAPSPNPPQPLILRCNGNGGGSLTNCLYPSAFLGCSLTRTDSTDYYETTITIERYTCTPPARRDAGECVTLSATVRLLDQYEYLVFADGHDKTIQILSLDVAAVNYSTNCTSKP